jgi:PilZ domain
MSTSNERRGESRLLEKTTVFVEVSSAEFDNSEPANVIVCSSFDLSPSGMQVEMDHEVPVGSILRICAELNDVDQALYLVGEVKWATQEDDIYKIGFELYDAENTDISGWRNVIDAMLDHHENEGN